MATKQKGKCPFCGESVTPAIIEKNMFRRDRCACPDCKEDIYICRSPGCHDFAKSTSSYDHEFCPSCTDNISNVAAEVGKATLKVAVGIATAFAAAQIKAGDDSKGGGKKKPQRKAS